MLNPFVGGSVGSEETAKVLHDDCSQSLLPHAAAVGPARLKTEFARFGRKKFRFWRRRLSPFCFAWQPLETKSNQIFGMQNTENTVFRQALFFGKAQSKTFRNSECKTSLTPSRISNILWQNCAAKYRCGQSKFGP